MGSNGSKRQPARANKPKEAARASTGKAKGIVAGLVAVAAVGMIGFALGRKTPESTAVNVTPSAAPLLSAAASNPPAPTSHTPAPASGPQTVHAPAAHMMGAEPEKEFVAGPNAVSLRQGAAPKTADAPIAGFDGTISLDPVCETVERNPRFAPGNPAPSTRKMAERLAALYAVAHPSSAGYLSDRMAEMLSGELTNANEVNEKFRLQFHLAIQQINAARPDSALNTFSAMERLVAESGGQLDEATRAELRLRKGMAFFRLGEQENCLATHNADSCVFPLRPKAVHLLPRGSLGAIAMFNAHLAEFPQDLSTRWLLNLAHMTLGDYPDKVNPQYLIPKERFASEYDMPRFFDVSDGLGVDANDLAGGVIVDDFDNDGFYDLVISAWDDKGQMRYFRNKGDGTFMERTSEAGLVGEVGALNISQTDYNNDGLLDIWMMRGGWLGKAGRIPRSLLRNNGDGTFTDVTEEAGLLSFHPTMATRWFDYDGDGWLDVFIGNESTDPNDPDWCQLYRNNRNGTFTECAHEVGIRVAEFVKAVACADYDNDGRPDLYLSVRGGRNILLRNEGPADRIAPLTPTWRFRDVTAQSGPIAEPVLGFGTFFFDYNNDGWQDIVAFGYFLPKGVGDVAADYLGMPHQGSRTKVYRNNGDGATFTDVTKEVRLDRICHTMGHNYGDLDNDGWLDFYCGTGDPDFRTLIPNHMFRNEKGRFFQDVTTATGTGHIQKGHGVAFADFDDDGCQDIYSTLGGAYSGDFARNALFLNPGSTNRWLKLKFVGVKANRVAIGARFRVTVQTPSGTRELHRVVSSGGSFGSNPLRQEIGLGDATAITRVDIEWPGSRTRQTLTGLELNRSYEIREGNTTPLALKLNRVNINRPVKTHAAGSQTKPGPS